MEGTTDIWCDGSYRQAHKTAGVGWVVRHPDGREEETAQPLPQIRTAHAYGSQIAELMAVAHALRALPAGAGPITVHMDCLLALQALQERKPPAYKDKNLPGLRAAFKAALAATESFAGVSLILSSDKTDHRMSRAHRLSREASAPKP